MKYVVIWSLIAAFFMSIFQTAVLSHISFLIMRPDLILLLVVYSAVTNGIIPGMITGFFAGILLDFLSLAPLGLHSFIFTLAGYGYGIIYRKYNVEHFFFPCAFGLTATLLKAALLFLLRFLFGDIVQLYQVAAFPFWFEVILNTLCAPVLFWFLRLFPSAFEVQEYQT